MAAAGYQPQHELAISRSYRVAAVRHYGAYAAVSVVAPDLARRCAPGRFVMVAVPGGALGLRRPLSLYAVRGDTVGLLIGARGPGSARLTGVDVGDELAVAGPLGTGFSLIGAGRALLVGGGIGTAPLQYLAEALAAAGAGVAAAFGFRDRRQAQVLGAFEINELSVATEDGSLGRRGTVIDLLEELDVESGTVIYTCGPPAMIGAVQRWSAAHGLRGEASLEAHMACGSGSCHGCVVATTSGLLRVCSEGPVFALDTVVEPS